MGAEIERPHPTEKLITASQSQWSSSAPFERNSLVGSVMRALEQRWLRK
jgi:hypothetical protein